MTLVMQASTGSIRQTAVGIPPEQVCRLMSCAGRYDASASRREASKQLVDRYNALSQSSKWILTIDLARPHPDEPGDQPLVCVE